MKHTWARAEGTLTIREAIEAMHKEKAEFLLTESGDVPAGIITKDSLLESLALGKTGEDCADVSYAYGICEGSFGQQAEEYLQNEQIRFFVIMDRENRAAEIISREEMEMLLFQSQDPAYTGKEPGEWHQNTFCQRPWGMFKTLIKNADLHSKIIKVNPNSRLSLQSHQHREEYWTVICGKGIVQIGDSAIEAGKGASFFIPKGCRHRLSNLSMDEPLILMEIQLGEYFGEDDIIRYEDMYSRS